MVGLKEGLMSRRLLEPGDREAAVADRHFAAFFGLKPGDLVQLGGKDFTIVGIAEQKQSSRGGRKPVCAASCRGGVGLNNAVSK